jgi:ParB family transcriptional regulator, chromosome partitioning protein
LQAILHAMAKRFDAAFIGVLHVLCLDTFYHVRSASCLEISSKSAGFSVQAPGLKDSVSAKAIEARHETWRAALPSRADDLWSALVGFDRDSREDLFAHCASLSVNAVHEPWNRVHARQTHADQLARAIDLDMSAAGWRATEENYLGRVSKARILEAVREGKDDKSAQLIGHLKKGDMAREAERLLAGSNWLPEPLRTPDVEVVSSSAEGDAADLPAFLQGDDELGADLADEDEAAPANLTLQAAE